MLYSGRHSAALVSLYSETFGEPVPEATMRKAAAGGRMQELMAAVDEATDSGVPVKDWNAFETQKAGAGIPLHWHEDDAGTAAARTVAGQRTLRIRPAYFDTRVVDVAFDRQLQWDDEPVAATAPAPVVVSSDHGKTQPEAPFKP